MRRLPVLTPLVIVLGGVLLAGCGGSSSENASTAASTPATKAATAAPVRFPSSTGKTLSEVRGSAPEGLVLAPSVSVLGPGRNRYGFALFDAARKPVAGAPVAVYVSRNDGSDLRGPFLARPESLVVKPQFESRTAKVDPDAAKSVYVADVQFPRTGKFRVSAIAQLDGRMVATTSFGAEVLKQNSRSAPPWVGSQAPKVHTPTLASVGGDASQIDTRSPAAKDLLETDLASVYGKKPVALLFATPALCQSRVCGPVVDVLEQARSERGDKEIAFIHNEMYRENRIDQGPRSQPAAYRLPTEPWLFVLDRHGRVAARIEGAFSADELNRALDRAIAVR